MSAGIEIEIEDKNGNKFDVEDLYIPYRALPTAIIGKTYETYDMKKAFCTRYSAKRCDKKIHIEMEFDLAEEKERGEAE